MFKLTIETRKNKITVADRFKNKTIIESENEFNNNKILAHGLYGVIDLERSKYLIYIAERNIKESFNNENVYEIAKIGMFKLDKEPYNHLKHLHDILDFLENSGIYYSSSSLHKEVSIGRSDGKDFLFNHHPLTRMDKFHPGLKQFSVNCIQGYYGVEEIDGVKLYLISRRSWRRIGARYFSRGSSSEGYVSNYVETEVFIQKEDNIVSFLQVRGSIPLVWSHEVMLAYTPKLVIHKEDHFVKCNHILKDKYAEVFYLNLIKNKNYEKPINDEFTMALKSNACQFLNYDLHNARSFSNISDKIIFIANMRNILDRHGFKTSQEWQRGVIRTNCIDCLDRTNLTQFVIAEYNIKKICEYLKIKNSEKILCSNRNLWFENGNILSLQYSGTGSLKSHIVRGTNRNLMGNMNDLYKSINRYFINRLSHGRLQNTYDVLTGKNVYKNRKKYTQKHYLSVGQTGFVFLLIGLFAVSNYVISPSQALFVFKGAVSFFLMIFIFFFLSRDYPEYEDLH